MRCSVLRLLLRVWTIFGSLALAHQVTGCRTTAGPSGRKAYVIKVEKGDTLAGLAQKYDTTVAKILRLNGFRSPRELYVGQTIRVEPGPSGLIIGDEPTRLPNRVKSSSAPKDESTPPSGPVATPDEFTEEDFTKVDEKSKEREERFQSSGRSRGERRGLLYGNPSGTQPKNQRGASRFLSWPVRGRLVSMYGKRGDRFHYGIDIAVRTGAGIAPAAPGKVVFAGEKPGYGQVVIVDHEGLQTLYAHLSQVSVALGETVESYSILGEVGETGNASGPHLHFEVKAQDGRLVNPLTLLPPQRNLT
jgi:murein DD-endopeptidase MepM/ murein hydrolase activator NlpD